MFTEVVTVFRLFTPAPRYRAWLCIPSARENGGTAKKWKDAGYGVALWRDPGKDDDVNFADMVVSRQWEGYSVAVNALCKNVRSLDPIAEWMVAGGDDTDPDPSHAPQEIANQCTEHFRGTWGVMQPTGDRFAGGCIDRICGSPWMGREFCARVNQGRGPLWPEYMHMFEDEELQNVALKLGILWQRRDLIHLHHQFTREPNGAVNWDRKMPEFLKEANSREHWRRFEKIFQDRRAAGFPGHEPLPVEVAA